MHHIFGAFFKGSLSVSRFPGVRPSVDSLVHVSMSGQHVKVAEHQNDGHCAHANQEEGGGEYSVEYPWGALYGLSVVEVHTKHSSDVPREGYHCGEDRQDGGGEEQLIAGSV